MRLTAAATLVFLALSYSSFAGDLEFNNDFEIQQNLKGTINKEDLNLLQLRPKSVSPWLSKPLRSIDGDPGFGADDGTLGHVDWNAALHPDPQHCPGCILNPLDPLPGNQPINVTPDILSGIRPGMTKGSRYRTLIASGGDDSEVLGCNMINSVYLKQAGRKLPQFSWRQFPEVVRLLIKQPGTDGFEGCTGTIVGEHWVLTAAHCITAKDSSKHASNDLSLPEDQDFVFSPPSAEQALQATVSNSVLTDVDKVRYADKAIVNKLYDRSLAGNSHDVALLHFENPFDPSDFPEASLATKFDGTATLAGYGVSNTKSPLGEFFVTFPPELVQNGEHLIFKPGSKKGAFCQGDSGGPVFVGLNRGCKSGDLFSEVRPRSVQGVISFNVETSAKSLAASCLEATNMYSEDVTQTEIHNWICGASGSEINGCNTQTAGASK
ncbi:trypsin-like serine protease [Mesorhizobium sp. WSM4310]|uniref:trypsin-like serine protease n=1 Tax=Mesorhizobium sp. WSM4310 TaxID=2589883 RepID=UPI00115D5F39|nr:trypsin-like serine protease [Mesorhizobium sp. WSM4310]TRC89697.1 trypsin-like serine protease [Mesorhizobium sp. WSM4310]